MNFFWRLLSSPWLYAGGLSYGISLVLWLLALKNLDISFARPLTSLGYIATYVLAVLFLGETLSVRRIAGTIVIIIGVVLIR